MRKPLLFLLLCFPLLTFCQESYQYKFSLNSISEPGPAKLAASSLENLFDTPPRFDDKNDVFEFASTVFIEEHKLRSKALLQGYVLEDYSRARVILKENE